MTNLSFNLAQFDEGYQQAEIRESNFTPIPDGTYQTQVETIEIKETKTGKPMLAWKLHIRGGDDKFIGKKLFKNSVITEKTLDMIKTDLHICGIDLQKFSDLPSHLPSLLDIGLTVYKKTNGQDPTGQPNVNIYFNKKTDDKLPPITKTPIGVSPGASGPSILPNEIINIDDQFNAGDLPF